MGHMCMQLTCRYHSHPIFAPKPSQKDNENQRNYQALFRCEKTRLEPFIGAIVGPYDLQLPTQVNPAFTSHTGWQPYLAHLPV